jgi:hypothetical protein
MWGRSLALIVQTVHELCPMSHKGRGSMSWSCTGAKVKTYHEQNGDMKEKGRLTNQLSVQMVNEDDNPAAACDETVPSMDGQSSHLPQERYNAMTCLMASSSYQ